MKAEEFLREKTSIEYDRLKEEKPMLAYNICKVMKEYAAMIFSEKVDETYQASQPPEPNTQRPEEIRTTSHKPEIIGKLYHTEPNKPLRVPFPDDFLKERNRKVEEIKSWSWQYDEGWSDCEDWLRLNQKKFDKEFVDEVEAMISASPEPNTDVLKRMFILSRETRYSKFNQEEVFEYETFEDCLKELKAQSNENK